MSSSRRLEHGLVVSISEPCTCVARVGGSRSVDRHPFDLALEPVTAPTSWSPGFPVTSTSRSLSRTPQLLSLFKFYVHSRLADLSQ